MCALLPAIQRPGPGSPHTDWSALSRVLTRRNRVPGRAETTSTENGWLWPHLEERKYLMTTQEPTDGQDSPLDRAAAEGPLPESSGDDEPGDGTEKHVPDSTEQAENASFP